MLDRHILPLQAQILRGPARWLSARGISANSMTVFGFVVGMAAAMLLALRFYDAALVCILLNRLCDGLDGAMAREQGATDRGAFLDVALDFFFYGAVPFGFALADPQANALAASVLLLSFIGTGSSFLAFAVIAAKRGLSSIALPQKGFYYLGGLTEGLETILFFIAACLWPAAFPVLAWGFAMLAFMTAAMRWWWGWKMFSA